MAETSPEDTAAYKMSPETKPTPCPAGCKCACCEAGTCDCE